MWTDKVLLMGASGGKLLGCVVAMMGVVVWGGGLTQRQLLI